MTKRQVIGRIIELNRSARAEFLAEFSEAELQQYLVNLEEIWSEFKDQFAEGCEHQIPAEMEPAAGVTG